MFEVDDPKDQDHSNKQLVSKRGNSPKVQCLSSADALNGTNFWLHHLFNCRESISIGPDTAEATL